MTSDRGGSHVQVAQARAAAWLALGGAAIGLAGLTGWITGTPWLITIVPGLPPMMPNTALALFVLGGAAAARQREDHLSVRQALSILAALVALVVSVGALAEYAFPVTLQLLRLTDRLVRQPPMAFPTNPSVIASLAIMFLGCAVLLLDVRATARVRPSELLAFCAAFTAFTGLTGIVLGAAPLYRSSRAPVIGLSLPTAASLLLISISLLLGPARGRATALASMGPGGSLIRRLSLPVTLVPILLGFGISRGAGAENLVSVAIPLAILTASTTAVSLFLLLVTAVSLNRANSRVQAGQARISELFEHAPDGIFIADLNGRYTDVNDAGCRMLGYSRDEILGKTIVDIILPSDVERLWRVRDELLKGGMQVAEWPARRKDGTVVPTEVSAKILPDGRWQGFVRDISERKRLQAQAEALYREAQRATQVRDDVMGIVAHDLRNPLAVVLTEVRLMKEHRRGADPMQSAAQIERAVMRMNRLIRDLLDVTRIEAGQLTVERARISPAQVAADAVESQRALASSACVELRLDVPSELPEILGDRDRLLQVFENLIGNAARFTPSGGSITVGAAREPTVVRFSVRDTGSGIDVDHQPHLFDRFWQAGSLNRGGAGLGLPIVRGIVEAHGGRVWVESAPGAGSAFLFEIPIAASA